MNITATTKTPWYALNSPELGKPLQGFYEACKENGILDRKTKELLMLALSSIFRCPNSSEEHIRSAIEAGASRAEITEVLLISAMAAADTQLAWNKDTFKKYLARE